MTPTIYLRTLPSKLLAAIAEHQREADLQASRWIEREVAALAFGRPAFAGNQPRITYTRRTKRAVISHGAT
jgi:hypothetical protein